jgi:hypothetical protein
MLVHSQLLAGGESAFAFVLSQHPSLDLEAIAKADGNISQYFSTVRNPATIVVGRLEASSEADDVTGIPHE